ncbi:MAG: glycosyltransferase [Chitinispirillaceae bacterium]
MISIIIPTLNDRPYIRECLQSIRDCAKETETETIVADGGSTDGTPGHLYKGIRVIRTGPGKAVQLNKAAALASGDTLLFISPLCRLPRGALNAVEHAVHDRNFDGGGFSTRFVSHDEKIKRAARIMNLSFRDPYFDPFRLREENGVFVHAGVFTALSGFHPVCGLEKYDFCCRMKKSYRIVRITEPGLLVSPERILQRGIWRTHWKMCAARSLYRLGLFTRLSVK